MVIAVVVTLPRQEFSNGGENLLIATATETQRTGRWLAPTLFDGWRWRAAIGAGLAIGLGMMSKGPVALVQSVAPLLVFVGWERWRSRRQNWPLKRPVRRWWGPIVVGFIAMLLVGLPWYLLILWKQPGVVGWWWKEVTREGATDLPPNSRLMYLVFFPSLAPWTVFFFAGIATAIGDMRARPADESAARRTRGLVFAVILVVVPLLIMTLFRDRKDRYTLPMTVPAAVVAAHGVMAYWRARSQGQNVRWLGAIHWAVVAVMAIGVPIIGAIGIDGVRTISGEPWFTWPLAISAAALAATVAALAVWREQVRCRGLVEMTVILMLALQVLFLTGYRKSNSGRSEMKPLADEIWAAFPDANVRVSGPDKIPVPPDLPLYLNRSVTWTAWPIQLQAGERPWVVVVRQRLKKKKTDPVPQCPPGWTALTPVKRDQNLWHAFALPAK
jgi:4-amino-4-deoxy-L-arabinose transferase-like glycosyltransferase